MTQRSGGWTAGSSNRSNELAKRPLLVLVVCLVVFAGPASDVMANPAKRRPLVKLDGSQWGRCSSAAARRAGRPRDGRSVDPGLLGTITRRDGRRQVTYRGHALCFYVHDPKGEVLCNDVFEFGGTWFALNAEGQPPS